MAAKCRFCGGFVDNCWDPNADTCRKCETGKERRASRILRENDMARTGLPRRKARWWEIAALVMAILIALHVVVQMALWRNRQGPRKPHSVQGNRIPEEK